MCNIEEDATGLMGVMVLIEYSHGNYAKYPKFHVEHWAKTDGVVRVVQLMERREPISGVRGFSLKHHMCNFGNGRGV